MTATATESLLAAIDAERVAHERYSAAWGDYVAGRSEVYYVAAASLALSESKRVTDAALRDALGVNDA